MDDKQFRWAGDPYELSCAGWIRVVTPLGASAHVPVGSAAHEVCDEWQLLMSGRGALCMTNPLEWFSAEELSGLPRGLLAELFAAAGLMRHLDALMLGDPQARMHILQLPDHVWGAEPHEWQLIGKCHDLALTLDARSAALAAVRESEENGEP